MAFKMQTREGSRLSSHAYVLLTTDRGCVQEVSKEIRSIPEVKNTYTLNGMFDLIIDIETQHLNSLKEIIQKRIRSLENVRTTIVNGQVVVDDRVLTKVDMDTHMKEWNALTKRVAEYAKTLE